MHILSGDNGNWTGVIIMVSVEQQNRHNGATECLKKVDQQFKSYENIVIISVFVLKRLTFIVS